MADRITSKTSTKLTCLLPAKRTKPYNLLQLSTRHHRGSERDFLLVTSTAVASDGGHITYPNEHFRRMMLWSR